MRKSARNAGIGAVLGGVAAAGASVYCTSQGAGALAEQCGQIAGTTVTNAAVATAVVVSIAAGLGTAAYQRLRSRF